MLKPRAFPLVLLLFSASLWAADDRPSAIAKAAVGEHRSAENIARNRYRHPVETLAFFDVRPGMTVVEISPGGGWYAEILAPLLKGNGRYVAASFDPAVPDQPPYYYSLTRDLQARFASEPVFSEAVMAKFSPPDSIDLGPPNSADRVLTFRNTHGWVRNGVAEVALRSFYDVLKPGGVLGVVQHRGPAARSGFTGYLTEAQVIRLAEQAGFVLEARSEINANPRDTKNYPENVWSLPPTLRQGEVDRDKYLAIGESDRMTLKFRKPAN